MRNKIFTQIKLWGFITFSILISGCGGYLDPDFDNTLTYESMLNPFRAEGILIKAYTYLPGGWDESDLATDNAVANVTTNNYSKASIGNMSSSFNPFGKWSNYYAAIGYVHTFIPYIDVVQWTADEDLNAAFKKRLLGESIALRAFYEVQLLKEYGGYDDEGNLLGYPIVRKVIETTSDWKKIKRSSYADCMKAILVDLDKAISLLPEEYGEKTELIANEVEGLDSRGRMSGNICKMLKAQLLLTAASPAFSEGSGVKWDEAAKAAAELMDFAGGLDNMTNNRTTFFTYNGTGNIDKDILWRRAEWKSYNLEEDNYPYSLRGNGKINPTHNLVASFPALNGYPISDERSGFDPTTPYANRDPRLSAYVVVNGSKFGKQNNVIKTTSEDTPDGVGTTANKSTRTGYYLRKFMNEKVVTLMPNKISAPHFVALMRYTELYLIYAEAANEAWGPTDKGGNAYSAYDVIKKMRETAGIDASDPYLESIKSDQEAMRQLIRNERRLELCFEGKRFWDIRRWKDLSLLNTPAYRSLDGGLTQDALSAEERTYEDYMIYLPIPLSEETKGLQQNNNW